MNKFNFKDNKVIIGIISIIIIIFLCVFFYTRSKMKNEYNELEEYEILQNETNNNIAEEIETEDEEDLKIIIHVTGAVKKEGVVKIAEGARIADAIDAAGGFVENADVSQINLAYQLEDGQKIYIPFINDEKTEGNEKVLQKEYVTEEPGDEVIVENEETSVKTKEKKININTAEQSELEEIPGVGESTALKIIEYRKTNGKFKNIEDIKNVNGIGDSKFENMKEIICVK